MLAKQNAFAARHVSTRQPNASESSRSKKSKESSWHWKIRSALVDICVFTSTFSAQVYIIYPGISMKALTSSLNGRQSGHCRYHSFLAAIVLPTIGMQCPMLHSIALVELASWQKSQNQRSTGIFASVKHLQI